MPGWRALPDCELLTHLAGGDKSAFDVLYDRFSPVIYITAVRFLRDEGRAADLVQEVFIQLWTDRKKFEDVKNLKAYLTILSRNLAIRYLKEIAREEMAREEWATQVFLSFENKTEDLFNKKELEKALNETIALLPPQQQKVYYLARIEGLTYKGISDRLNISTVTVKKHMIAANRFVRDHISRQQEI